MIVQVPINALRLPGIYSGPTGPGGKETEDVKPEAGDPVSFSVEGVVTGVSGSMATVDVRLINGERPDSAGASEKKIETTNNPEISEADMEKAAREADEEEYV